MADGLYEVEEIIGRRVTEAGKQEFLVHWKKYNSRESTWEPLENLNLNSASEFLYKAYPIPGVRPLEILHLKPKRPLNIAKPLKLKRVSQMNKKKLKGIANKDILDEIMKEQAKEIEMKKEQRKGRRSKRKPEEDAARFVLRSEDSEAAFNGLPAKRSLRSDTHASEHRSPKKKVYGEHVRSHQNNNFKQVRSPRKSKDRALLAMATACVTNNFDWTDNGHFLAERTVRRTHIKVTTETVTVTKDGPIIKLTICNESKKNTLTIGMCEQMISALHDAAKDDVHVVIITGSGSTFCSGLDYSCVFNNCTGGHHKSHAKLLVEKFKLLIEMIINFSKPLVAAVNGDALGCGTSILALCDIIYLSSKSTLQTGFAKWGHTPIGCSSLTLPQLLGRMKACSVLLLNEEMSATEALDNGLAMEVFDSKTFGEEVRKRVTHLADMPSKCVQATKDMLRQYDIQTLHDINADECKLLVKYLSDEQGIATMSKSWRADVME